MDATLEASTLGGSWEQEPPCPHPSQGAKEVQRLEQEELEVEQQVQLEAEQEVELEVQGVKEATFRVEQQLEGGLPLKVGFEVKSLMIIWYIWYIKIIIYHNIDQTTGRFLCFLHFYVKMLTQTQWFDKGGGMDDPTDKTVAKNYQSPWEKAMKGDESLTSTLKCNIVGPSAKQDLIKYKSFNRYSQSTREMPVSDLYT